MTDRTGGPSALNYAHRRRPENYEEDEEENSEGEDVMKLKARAGNTNQSSGDDEDRRLDARDLVLARTLRVRAEGLEKVATAMLGQPPPFHAMDNDDLLTPPTSPKANSSPSSGPVPHHHTLPNGVRLRLALGTIINDLFARQAPNPPYRHQFLASRTPSELSPPDSSAHTCEVDGIPRALSSLSTVCAACSGSVPSYSGSPELQPSSSPLTGYPVSISVLTVPQILNILLHRVMVTSNPNSLQAHALWPFTRPAQIPTLITPHPVSVVPVIFRSVVRYAFGPRHSFVPELDPIGVAQHLVRTRDMSQTIIPGRDHPEVSDLVGEVSLGGKPASG